MNVSRIGEINQKTYKAKIFYQLSPGNHGVAYLTLTASNDVDAARLLRNKIKGDNFLVVTNGEGNAGVIPTSRIYSAWILGEDK
jgi:hypothetical protein